MLIDEYLPQYDTVERHATVVRASAPRIYAALRTADLAACPLVRLLLAFRTLPAVLRDGGSGVLVGCLGGAPGGRGGTVAGVRAVGKTEAAGLLPLCLCG